MNAARTRAPEAAGAEGTRLASGGSLRLRRRGQPEESQAAAPRRAAGALQRFLSAPSPRPYPAATPGRASGWLRRQRWAELLVLGLLVAGAADGCELVPRHFGGRRTAGSAAAATSSPAVAAGDSPALMTGEGPGGGGRGSASCCGTPIPGRDSASAGCPLFDRPGRCAMPSRALRRQCPDRGFVAVPCISDDFP